MSEELCFKSMDADDQEQVKQLLPGLVSLKKAGVFQGIEYGAFHRVSKAGPPETFGHSGELKYTNEDQFGLVVKDPAEAALRIFSLPVHFPIQKVYSQEGRGLMGAFIDEQGLPFLRVKKNSLEVREFYLFSFQYKTNGLFSFLFEKFQWKSWGLKETVKLGGRPNPLIRSRDIGETQESKLWLEPMSSPYISKTLLKEITQDRIRKNIVLKEYQEEGYRGTYF